MRLMRGWAKLDSTGHIIGAILPPKRSLEGQHPTRMMIFRKAFAVGMVLALNFPAFAAPALPEFKELYELLHTNLTGVTEAELNRAAVRGLIEQLAPRVTL